MFTERKSLVKHLFTLMLILSLFSFLIGCEESSSNVSANPPEETTEVTADEDAIEEESSDGDSNSTPDEEVEQMGSSEYNGELQIHFIDVGQGDSTLFKYIVDNEIVYSMIFDVGRHDRNDVVEYLKSIDSLDSLMYMILSHPHADHIGQADKILENFEVGTVWMSGDEHTTQTFERTLDAILASEDTNYHEPRAGEVHELGPLTIEVINPEKLTGDLHEGSIGIRVIYHDFAVVLTGDAEYQTEYEILERAKRTDGNYESLQAQVLQLGHHGSRTSSTMEFLEAVNPDFAIASYGKDNQYGHPHQPVLSNLDSLGIILYGTAVHGTIVVTTDGFAYDITSERNGNISTSEESEPNTEETETVTSEPSCIDINSAPVEELVNLIHIGESRAEQLIELRPYETLDGLTAISGIGASRVSDIKDEGLACVK
ncbi:beta-lactamase superfamily II metal-dependent hydrolase [Evansella vedderi]|uniref:Beta-lactamase superfamily II metal-dependent hydrolase n=1 Tax=Evansella vedderi TaxID=38282 RepID=A0ABT9ZW47_9BACI|nr:MBL fold metallo-hydrolase [Evansella vedderi]MDQ0255454.1 beta-lactamase superfamily II metal-dependent hydrolase [Evansella vedderi]